MIIKSVTINKYIYEHRLEEEIMAKVAVVYWSGTGNTESMANALAKGAGADLFTSDDFSADKLEGYDVLAMGCPAMGGEELEDSSFAPMYDSIKAQLSGKSVFLFGSYDWGDGEWMRLWEQDAKENGANIVEESVIVNLTPDDEQLSKLEAIGAKLKA